MRELHCPVPAPSGKSSKLFAQLDTAEAVFRVACPGCRKTAARVHADLVHVLHRGPGWSYPGGCRSSASQVGQ